MNSAAAAALDSAWLHIPIAGAAGDQLCGVRNGRKEGRRKEEEGWHSQAAAAADGSRVQFA